MRTLSSRLSLIAALGWVCACAGDDGDGARPDALVSCEPFAAVAAGGSVVEYAAQLEDDRYLVVTRPEGDFSYDDFRLFLGPEQALREREIHAVTRARDGGSTTIELDLDGEHAVAEFPVVFDPDTMTFEPGRATLTVGEEHEELTRLDEPPASAEYLCFPAAEP